MYLTCIKTCYEQGAGYPKVKHKYFTKGKRYWVLTYIPKDGYKVRDDDNEDHWIYMKGHKFFDRHFKKDGE